MNFEENKSFWEEFIEMYKAHPCLWDIRSKEYFNRHIRNNAYDVLVTKCREKYPSADRQFVTRKINSLRSSFRRQHRKVMESSYKTGRAADDVLEPTLWYYNLLLFTLDHEEFCPDVSTVLEEVVSGEEIDGNDIDDRQLLSPDISLSTTPSMLTNEHSTRKRKMKIIPGEENDSWTKKRKELTDVVSQYLMDGVSENEWDIFGKSVGLQCKGIVSQQAIIAQKLITDVLFYAKLEKLTCDTTVRLSAEHGTSDMPQCTCNGRPSSAT